MATRKIVLNSGIGGYGLSFAAIRRLAELQGKKCYFFENIDSEKYSLIENPAGDPLYYSIFDTADLSFIPTAEEWSHAQDEERKRWDNLFNAHCIEDCWNDRTNPLLVQVVEELGEEANSLYSSLKVIEIPDDIEYDIRENHGHESVHEKSRRWE